MKVLTSNIWRIVRQQYLMQANNIQIILLFLKRVVVEECGLFQAKSTCRAIKTYRKFFIWTIFPPIFSKALIAKGFKWEHFKFHFKMGWIFLPLSRGRSLPAVVQCTKCYTCSSSGKLWPFKDGPNVFLFSLCFFRKDILAQELLVSQRMFSICLLVLTSGKEWKHNIKFSASYLLKIKLPHS